MWWSEYESHLWEISHDFEMTRERKFALYADIIKLVRPNDEHDEMMPRFAKEDEETINYKKRLKSMYEELDKYEREMNDVVTKDVLHVRRLKRTMLEDIVEYRRSKRTDEEEWMIWENDYKDSYKRKLNGYYWELGWVKDKLVDAEAEYNYMVKGGLDHNEPRSANIKG